MYLRGLGYGFGSLEESLAQSAFIRNSEIEFLKLQVIVGAIMQVGGKICAAVSGGDAPQGNSLQKALDGLEKLMLPHRAEERDKKAARLKKVLQKEYTRGPMKVKVVGNGSKGKKRNPKRKP